MNPPGGPSPAPFRAAPRRGLTLLEAVLATAMLAIVGLSLIAAVRSIWRHQLRQEQTLGAAELANRLILNFLDDDTQMPSESLPVEYGPYRYRWKLTDAKVATRIPPDLPPEARRRREERSGRPAMDRVRAVTIRVWLSEESEEDGGSFAPAEGTPQFEITRLYDPLYLQRNPDSLKKVLLDRDRFIDRFSGLMAPPADPRPARSGERGRQ